MDESRDQLGSISPPGKPTFVMPTGKLDLSRNTIQNSTFDRLSQRSIFGINQESSKEQNSATKYWMERNHPGYIGKNGVIIRDKLEHKKLHLERELKEKKIREPNRDNKNHLKSR